MSLLYANSQTWYWVCLVYCMIITWKLTKHRKGRTGICCTFQISSYIASILYHQLALVLSILSSSLLLLFIIIFLFYFLGSCFQEYLYLLCVVFIHCKEKDVFQDIPILPNYFTKSLVAFFLRLSSSEVNIKP